MPEPNLYISENPLKAVSELLSLTILASEAMIAAIELMDVPVGKWKIRSHAMLHTKDMKALLITTLDEHRKVRDELTSIGY